MTQDVGRDQALEQSHTDRIREFLLAMGHSLQQYQHSFACSAELPRHEFNVLFVLHQKGPLVCKEIAHEVPAISLSTLTRLLDSLEHKGLIERKLDPNDRRSFIIAPTEEACELMQGFPQHVDCFVQRVARALSPEEQELFTALLTKIKSQL